MHAGKGRAHKEEKVRFEVTAHRPDLHTQPCVQTRMCTHASVHLCGLHWLGIHASTVGTMCCWYPRQS